MRELTSKELDAVCGGLFDFSLGANSPIIKQVIISQLNTAGRIRQSGLLNMATVSQANVAIVTMQ
jgi:hypothetical protein